MFFCKKQNHRKKYCRKNIEWKKKKTDHKVKTAQQCDEVINEDSSSPHTLFIACETDIKDAWYIDSGATSHMCSNVNFFANLKEQYSGQIKLAVGDKLKISGIGLCLLKCLLDNQQSKIEVTDVLYVPQLKGNLISVRKLTRKGFKVIFKEETCKIMKGSQQSYLKIKQIMPRSSHVK